MKEFLSDVKELLRRARQHLEQGPVTDGYKADRKQVIAVRMKRLRRSWSAFCVTNVITYGERHSR